MLRLSVQVYTLSKLFLLLFFHRSKLWIFININIIDFTISIYCRICKNILFVFSGNQWSCLKKVFLRRCQNGSFFTKKLHYPLYMKILLPLGSIEITKHQLWTKPNQTYLDFTSSAYPNPRLQSSPLYTSKTVISATNFRLISGDNSSPSDCTKFIFSSPISGSECSNTSKSLANS